MGGGISGDFPICVVPMLAWGQDVGIDVNLWFPLRSDIRVKTIVWRIFRSPRRMRRLVGEGVWKPYIRYRVRCINSSPTHTRSDYGELNRIQLHPEYGSSVFDILIVGCIWMFRFDLAEPRFRFHPQPVPTAASETSCHPRAIHLSDVRLCSRKPPDSQSPSPSEFQSAFLSDSVLSISNSKPLVDSLLNLIGLVTYKSSPIILIPALPLVKEIQDAQSSSSPIFD